MVTSVTLQRLPACREYRLEAVLGGGLPGAGDLGRWRFLLLVTFGLAILQGLTAQAFLSYFRVGVPPGVFCEAGSWPSLIDWNPSGTRAGGLSPESHCPFAAVRVNLQNKVRTRRYPGDDHSGTRMHYTQHRRRLRIIPRHDQLTSIWRGTHSIPIFGWLIILCIISR